MSHPSAVLASVSASEVNCRGNVSTKTKRRAEEAVDHPPAKRSRVRGRREKLYEGDTFIFHKFYPVYINICMI